ncbi:MAG TPA: M67 family metallopeptidase [Candidatus Limnocylindrales bacterium]|nr:M67 family metallopeptidase [Candidatus Limnocylindrales bacterium]
MIYIQRSKLEEIYQHAEATYPEECCGIITGPKDQDIWRVYRITNIQNELHRKDPNKYKRDARIAYYMEPQEMMRVFQQAEEQKEEIKGFYHSHPEHEAYFSQEDKYMALSGEWGEPMYPDAFHMVVSVYGGKVKNARIFIWDERIKDFKEEAFQVKD